MNYTIETPTETLRAIRSTCYERLNNAKNAFVIATLYEQIEELDRLIANRETNPVLIVA